MKHHTTGRVLERARAKIWKKHSDRVKNGFELIYEFNGNSRELFLAFWNNVIAKSSRSGDGRKKSTEET